MRRWWGIADRRAALWPVLLIAPALLHPAGIGMARSMPGDATPATFWPGTIDGPPLTPSSPLAPVPAIRDRARLLVLPRPEGAMPPAATIPFAEGGGGPVTLLARRGKGWLVGRDAGEWGGAL